MRRRHQKSQKFYWSREQPNGNPKAGNEFSKIKTRCSPGAVG